MPREDQVGEKRDVQGHFYRAHQWGGAFPNTTVCSVPLKVAIAGELYDDVPHSEAIFQALKSPDNPVAQAMLKGEIAGRACQERGPQCPHGWHDQYTQGNSPLDHLDLTQKTVWDTIKTQHPGIAHDAAPDPEWTLKEQCMFEILLIKATQNPWSLAYLLWDLPDNRWLVERTANDDFWGSGSNSDYDSQGRNALGRCYWLVSQELKDELKRTEKINVRYGFSRLLQESLGWPRDTTSPALSQTVTKIQLEACEAYQPSQGNNIRGEKWGQVFHSVDDLQRATLFFKTQYTVSLEHRTDTSSPWEKDVPSYEKMFDFHPFTRSIPTKVITYLTVSQLTAAYRENTNCFIGWFFTLYCCLRYWNDAQGVLSEMRERAEMKADDPELSVSAKTLTAQGFYQAKRNDRSALTAVEQVTGSPAPPPPTFCGPN